MKVVIIGMSGAGKSTLARELAELLHAPHVELDGLFWGPQWEPRMPAQFRGDVARALAGPAWVVDGNYSGVRDLVWPHADAIVWLNLPFTTVFTRVFIRTMQRSLCGQALWSGNRESLWRAFFSRESILRWVITAYARRKREFAAVRDSGQYPNLRWIELRRSAPAVQVFDRIGGA